MYKYTYLSVYGKIGLLSIVNVHDIIYSHTIN